MSPKVTITLTGALAQLLKEPRTRVLEALAVARAQGIRLHAGEAGVVPGLAGWRLDRHMVPNGVSVVGAVLLHLQPEPREREDYTAAAARALEASPTWATGLLHGWDRDVTSPAHLRAPDRQLYLDGYQTGIEARAAFAALG